jgi:soluble lytic murein transglycosylase-like protein
MMTSALRAAMALVLVLAVAAPAPAEARKLKRKKPVAARIIVKPKPDPGFLARDAFYSGEIEKAYPMAIEAGERWVAGLAAYRLQNYLDAFQRFQSVAEDPAEDSWTRSGAAYWAARAATAAGLDALERPYLQMAAALPHTFYGMIAERQLGVQIASATRHKSDGFDPLGQLIRVANGFTSRTPIGATPAGGTMAPIPDGYVAQGPSGNYPIPVLEPLYGFTIDQALVYAVVHQESRFNPIAGSPVGAVGLMQLMPATAAFLTGDDTLRKDRSLLHDPKLNLRLGQDYLNYLANGLVGDNLLMVIAGYNGGPGAVQKVYDRVGRFADPLMQIESLPAKETREYVEKVMAGYWIYSRQFGAATPSLDALASGAQTISLRRPEPNVAPHAGPRLETAAAAVSLF